MQNGRISAVNASNQLVDLTKEFKKFGEDEVSLAALILENIVSPGNVKVLNKVKFFVYLTVDVSLRDMAPIRGSEANVLNLQFYDANSLS